MNEKINQKNEDFKLIRKKYKNKEKIFRQETEKVLKINEKEKNELLN